MNERISNLIITAVLFLFYFLAKDAATSTIFFGVFIGAATTTSINLLTWGISSYNNFSNVFKALFIRKLRISCSYLYRIKVNDHYLLIKSRKHGKFQPVGGNFKRNQYSSDFLSKIELSEDDKFTNGNRSKDDLRLYIRGWDFRKFLKWYNAPDKNRETSYDREFYEELVEPKFLPVDLFPYPIIDFRKQIIRPVIYSTYLKCKEIHIYDVVELKPTVEQFEFLKELKAHDNIATLKWVSSKTIKDQGYEEVLQGTPYEITDHSQVVVDFKYSKLNN